MHVEPRAVQNSLFSIAKPDKSKSENFSSEFRLLRKDGFNHVFHTENISDKYFKIFFVPNNRKNSRLGIIASKKTFTRAVDRNRVKRIVREVFRLHSIKIRKLDLIVMVLRAYAQQRSTQRENLEMLFSRAENKCAEL